MTNERITRGFLTAALIAIAAHFVWSGYYSAKILRSDISNIDGVEPNVVFEIEQLMIGRPLYSRPDH